VDYTTIFCATKIIYATNYFFVKELVNNPDIDTPITVDLFTNKNAG